MKTKQTAQHAYTAAADEINGLVSQLQTMTDKLHDISPDSIHWGNVGDLGRIKAALSEVLSTFNNEG